ncbi:MAG: helix-turn-helix transcriptional regulator [Clostridia bacterium]
MRTDMSKTGEYIKSRRKDKNLTQEQLGERLAISFQAVSKWERGESLPDSSLLLALSDILETTVDSLLNGGDKKMDHTRKVTVGEIREGVACLDRMKSLLGRKNSLYTCAVEGINRGMNVDIEESLSHAYTREAFVAEALIQNLQDGAYVDLTDVKTSFEHSHWRDIVLGHARKHGMK